MTRSILTAALAVAAIAAGATEAGAATVDIEGDALVYRGDPGERNLVFVEPDRSGSVALRDLGVSRMLIRHHGCRRGEPGTVLCQSSMVESVRAELEDGDDSFSSTSRVPSVVDAGPGNDVFAGRAVRVDPITNLNPAASVVDFTGGSGRDTAHFRNVVDERLIQDGVSVTKNDQPDDGRPIDRNNVRSDVEVLEGSPQDDFLAGAGGSDVLVSGKGNDTLAGKTGDDVFEMGAVRDGQTRVFGGADRDTVSYAQRTRPVLVSPDDPAFRDGEAGELDSIEGAEVIEGGTVADNLVTPPLTTLGYRLIGGAGDDTLSSGNGRDRLIGGAGIDRFTSGGERDAIEARDGARETIDCGSNGDDVAELDGNDQVRNCESRLIPLPSFIGVPRLSPGDVAARTGRPARLRVDWTHPTDWRRLDAVTLTLAHRGRTVGRVVLDQETRRVTASGSGVRVAPGSVAVRAGRRARRVSLRLALRFDRRHAGRRLEARLSATDDRGARQPSRRVGSVHVR